MAMAEVQADQNPPQYPTDLLLQQPIQLSSVAEGEEASSALQLRHSTS